MWTDHLDFMASSGFPKAWSVGRYLSLAATEEAADWSASVLSKLKMRDVKSMKKNGLLVFVD